MYELKVYTQHMLRILLKCLVLEKCLQFSSRTCAKAPQGLSVSFANFRDASSTVLTALMLDTWMLMLSQTVEAVGPSAVIFAVAILILGPFFTQQLFVATMAVQLEKLHDRGSVDVAKRIINQWFHVIQFRAFAKWKAHWFENHLS